MRSYRLDAFHAVVTALLAATIVAGSSPAGAAQGKSAEDLKHIHARLAEEVRHQLVLLPYYGVFDDLAFEIKGVDTVVLLGQVTRPTLKTDAQRAISRIEGVGQVVNQIEVLPLSPSDDKIRLAAFRAIYSRPGLDRYAVRAVPPIHIIVKNGKITLTGVVATESDKNMAGIAANGVPGVFEVTNNLRVEK